MMFNTILIIDVVINIAFISLYLTFYLIIIKIYDKLIQGRGANPSTVK